MDMKLHETLRAGHVHRWNIVATMRQQSIAEHMWNVTMIATELTLKMELPDPAPTGFVGMCLKHDRHEVITGDVPTPTKRKLSGTIQREWYTDVEFGVDPEYDALKAHYAGSLYEHVLKIADILEGDWFLFKWGVHNDAHVLEIRSELRHRRQKAISDGQMNWPQYAWEQSVTRTWMDMT